MSPHAVVPATRGELLDELRRFGAYADDLDDLKLLEMLLEIERIATLAVDEGSDMVHVNPEYLRVVTWCAEALLTEDR